VRRATPPRGGRGFGPGRGRGRAGPAAADPDDQLRHDRGHGADGRGADRGGRADGAAGPGGHRRGGRRGPRPPGPALRPPAPRATPTVLPTVFALVQGRAGREPASIDPHDPASPHYHDEEEESREPARPSDNGEPRVPQPQAPAGGPDASAAPGHEPRP